MIAINLRQLTLFINIDKIFSSGTNVNWSDLKEREYFENTLAVLDRHGIKPFAKLNPEQLSQERMDDSHDIIILMNQRVIDEAKEINPLSNVSLFTSVSWCDGWPS